MDDPIRRKNYTHLVLNNKVDTNHLTLIFILTIKDFGFILDKYFFLCYFYHLEKSINKSLKKNFALAVPTFPVLEGTKNMPLHNTQNTKRSVS